MAQKNRAEPDRTVLSQCGLRHGSRRIFRMLSGERQYFPASSSTRAPDLYSRRMARFLSSSSARVPLPVPHRARPSDRGTYMAPPSKYCLISSSRCFGRTSSALM